MGNPFCELSSEYLLVLDTRDLADAAVIDTLNQIEKLGQDWYDTYSGGNKYLIPCKTCLSTWWRNPCWTAQRLNASWSRSPGL